MKLTLAELETAPMSDLVRFFNAHSETKVNRFSDRKSAIRRCAPFAVAEPKPSDSRAAAIARSWQDPQIRAARASRTNVTVDGQIYRSVAAAYRDLELPMADHIRFRARLKAEGTVTDSAGRVWVAQPVQRD